MRSHPEKFSVALGAVISCSSIELALELIAIELLLARTLVVGGHRTGVQVRGFAPRAARRTARSRHRSLLRNRETDHERCHHRQSAMEDPFGYGPT